jgi:hypothetical protein
MPFRIERTGRVGPCAFVFWGEWSVHPLQSRPFSVLTMSPSPCFYAFMRTTVELPPELMKQAKASAAARGESLKTLLTRAVASELGESRWRSETAVRVRLPVFGNPKGRPVDISNKDVARALAHDDSVQAAMQPRKKRQK